MTTMTLTALKGYGAIEKGGRQLFQVKGEILSKLLIHRGGQEKERDGDLLVCPKTVINLAEQNPFE
jgi:hypothetical protein